MIEFGIHYCALAQVLLLIFFCARKSSLRTRGNYVYLCTLLIVFVSLAADLGSIYAIMYEEHLPTLLVLVICRTYVSSLVIVSYMCYWYLIVDLAQWGTYRKLWRAGTGYLAFGVLLIWILPIHRYYDGRALYTYGPSVITTYIFSVSFILADVIVAAVCRKRMNRRRVFSVFGWIIIVMLAVVIQFLHNELLLVGFASALGMTVFFAEIENPDFYIDRESGVFSAHTLMEFMSECFINKKKFSGLDVILSTEKELLDREEQKVMLVSVANFLSKLENVKVFRNVGNEFAVLFEEEEEMFRLLPEIEDFLREPIEAGKTSIQIHPKFIILPDSRLAKNANDVFRFRRLLTSSEANTDRIIVDEELVRFFQGKENIKTMIKDAIDSDRVEVFYQPIYSAKKKKFCSAEALVRIRDLNGRIIPPGLFIPVAEESGQILELGRIVFYKVCQFLKEHDISEMGMEYIEINLSVAQCEQATLAEDYVEILSDLGVAPHQINLEITETASMAAKEVLLQNMSDFSEVGVRFSLDDFGTGQSNLNYIMSMPVDIVKFDHSIVRDYFVNEKAKYVVENVVRMVQQMGMEVVAEGVETREQLEEFLLLGVDFIQGFYFSKPVPGKEFKDFICENNYDSVRKDVPLIGSN